MALEDDSTHFQCVSCDNIKVVAQVNIVKVAFNTRDVDTQREFKYIPYWCMMCDGCIGKIEKKESGKDGGDTDTGSGRK